MITCKECKYFVSAEKLNNQGECHADTPGFADATEQAIWPWVNLSRPNAKCGQGEIDKTRERRTNESKM